MVLIIVSTLLAVIIFMFLLFTFFWGRDKPIAFKITRENDKWILSVEDDEKWVEVTEDVDMSDIYKYLKWYRENYGDYYIIEGPLDIN